MKGTLIRVAGFVVLIIMLASPVRAQEKTIPPGTTITMHNWQQYKDFMPIGMQAMFAGIYFWKMPADIQIEVGPTSNYPLNPAYVANTEKYADRVQIVDLPDGEHTLQGYVAGRPFPNPSGPRKGWEILVDEWYRYIPYEVCTSNVWWAYLNDRYNNMTSESGRESYPHVAHQRTRHADQSSRQRRYRLQRVGAGHVARADPLPDQSDDLLRGPDQARGCIPLHPGAAPLAAPFDGGAMLAVYRHRPDAGRPAHRVQRRYHALRRHLSA